MYTRIHECTVYLCFVSVHNLNEPKAPYLETILDDFGKDFANERKT